MLALVRVAIPLCDPLAMAIGRDLAMRRRSHV
jgi:hypothetical protein